MRYMPTLRSPVSGSWVTTQGRVMKRPPSRGQHFWMGKSSNVGQASSLSLNSALSGEEYGDRLEACPTLAMLGALGQLSTFPLLTSNFLTTSLHGPVLTSFGLAWRKSRAAP